MTLRRRLIGVPLGLLLLCSFAGCGSDTPDLGTVSGVVTLDGKPLENAAVYFEPDEGRTSHGVTDKEGRYELVFSEGHPGAILGPHTVRIRREPTPEELIKQGTDPQAPQPQPLPARYDGQSTLKATVKAGTNTFDFPLESKEH